MLRIDLHTHSLMSGHALNTVYEMAAEAKARGLHALGIAEHGPSMRGAAHEGYFWVSDQIEERCGLPILLGVEANILSVSGALDLPEELLAKQRNVLAGLHEHSPYQGRDVDDHTLAIVSAMRNPHVRIIAHPYRQEFPVNISTLVEEACRNRVLLEINDAVFAREGQHPRFIEAYGQMIELCARKGHPIVIGSDAHVAHRIGHDDAINAVYDAIGLRDDIIINQQPIELMRWKKAH